MRNDVKERLADLPLRRRDFKKQTKKVLKCLVSEHGFSWQGTTTLLRVHSDVAHMIVFEPTSVPHCNVAVQPLYHPFEGEALGLGQRLVYLARAPGAKVRRATWKYGSPDDNRQTLEEMLLLVNETVLPWFDTVGSPTGLVEYLERRGGREITPRVTEEQRLMYLGYTYLYLGDYESGIQALQTVIDSWRRSSHFEEWFQKDVQQMEELCGLARHQPHEVSVKLREYVNYTKSEIGIRE